MARTNDVCGHLDRKHHSKGRCRDCYAVFSYRTDPERRDKSRKKARDWYVANKERARNTGSAYRAANPEKIRDVQIAYRAANTEKLRAKNKAYAAAYPERTRAAQLRIKYGLTLEQYEQLLEKQEGLCAICQRERSTKRHLAVDHCHTTGKIRGLLCSTCNTALGKFRDSQILLHRAADYLDERGFTYEVPS